MNPSALVGQLASQGLLGVVCALALYIAWRKDTDLETERKARVDDAKDYTDRAIKLQAQVLDSVNKLAEVFDEVKKMVVAPQNRSTFGGNR